MNVSIGCISVVLELIDNKVTNRKASAIANLLRNDQLCSGLESLSCDEFTNTTSGSDALFGTLGEKLGAYDAWCCGELTLSENFEEPLFKSYTILVLVY